MIRKSVAGAILGISLLVGSFAWSGFVALRTIFDPDKSGEVAEELLDNEEVTEQVAINVAAAINSLIPPEVPVSDEVVIALTQQVLQDPAVEAIIFDAFVDTHRAFLGEGDAPEAIDLSEVALVARQRLVSEAPRLEALLPETPTFIVPLPTEHVPDAGPLRRFTESAVPILAIVSIGGALLALLATNERPAILRRAGRWALTTTIVFLFLALGVPALLREFAPDQAEVVAALLSGLLRSVLIPSIVLGAIGVGLLLISMAWAAQARSAPSRAVRPAEARPSPVPVAPVPTRAAPSKAKPDRRTGQPGPPPSVPATTPGPSPYPDDAHQRSQVARDWGPPPSPYPDAPAAPGAPEETNASVFADVPIHAPAEPVRPSSYEPNQVLSDRDAAAPPPPSPDESRSVFAEPAAHSAQHPPAPPPNRPASSAPPVGARWSHEYGWVLDPDNPDPLPIGSVWVEGVGYVLPATETI
ncbi:MAG: hypothetical protein ACR2PK_05545 [Acidimicrobiales bacterium]